MPDDIHLGPSGTAAATEFSVLQIGMGWFPDQPGGLDRVFHSLLCHLPEVGIAVRGCVAGSHQLREVTGNGVVALASPTDPLPYRLWRARQTISQVLREYSPDLLAAHFALFAWPVLDVIRGYPFVVHFHGPWCAETAVEGAGGLRRGVQRAIERAVYGRAVRLIALSHAFAQILSDSYGVPEERIRIVPGGVDAQRFAV
jgi:glycogen(starch) synthase